MNFHFTLEKVLSVKENEKNMLEVEYRNAYQDFEQIAKALYEFLQQKETLENQQLEGMTRGTAIEEIRKLQTSVELLERKIDHYEVLYQNARQNAEQKKGLLLEQAIDVKRYEKLRDLEYDQFIKKNKAEEMSKLDEISTIRHLQQ
ncbi:MAG TPA: flagellar export protein FliJ [Bacillales bacterium]|nr:flagellar export protein FliJ [Bacillales bacterium]